MGWEARGNHRYYYKKQRRGGRVVSTYYGTGLLADYAAMLNELEQRKQADQRRALHIARQEQQHRERDATTLTAQCDELVRVALLAAGFHQHKGTWRKRRMQGAMMTKPKKQTSDLPALPAPGDTSPEARKAIIKRCNRRDATPEDVRALRHILPHLNVTEVGDNVRNALAYTVKVATDGNAWLQETAQAHLAQRRADLGYDTCPVLERTLIDHLLLCEVRLGMMETFVTSKTAEHVTVAQMRQPKRCLMRPSGATCAPLRCWRRCGDWPCPCSCSRILVWVNDIPTLNSLEWSADSHSS